MKKIFASAMIFTVGLVMAQTDAYKGVGDIKVNLGANLQDGGTGIVSSVDYGLGESFSIGAQAGYLLGVKEIGGEIPKFGDRFDLKVRLNANLGSVLKLPSNVDVYPGLNLGLKNFGGHLEQDISSIKVLDFIQKCNSQSRNTKNLKLLLTI